MTLRPIANRYAQPPSNRAARSGRAQAGWMTFLNNRGWRMSLLVLLSCVIAGMNLSCGKTDQPETVWGRGGRGPGEMIYPRAIAKSPDGTFFVVDRSARVQHFDANGQFLNGWVMAEWSQGKPVGLTVDADGNLWVPDTHYHRIIIFTPDGKEIRRFGTRGTGAGEFDLPTDIAFDRDGNIYISEYGDNNRVQVFDRNFKYLRGWGKIGDGPSDLARPQSMVIVDDELYVTDSCNHRISVFGLDGSYRRTLGHTGGNPGEYRFPYGLEIDQQNNLIVTEFGNNRVQKLDRLTGAPLASWGQAGRLPGELTYPWASITLGDRVVVVDAGNNRMQVFRFGK